MLTVFRTCLDGILDGFSLALERSGVECVGWGVGNTEGLDGVFSRDGVCGRLFLGGLLVGRGGRAPVGGSARGREATDKDMMPDTVLESAVLVIPCRLSGVELRLSCLCGVHLFCFDRSAVGGKSQWADARALLLKQ
jgi:hypothetical protein